MGDKERIEKILGLIREIWYSQPQWRLTQLIMNAVKLSGDPFYIPDSALEEGLINLKKELKERDYDN